MKQINVLLIGDEARRGIIKAGLRGRRDIRLAGEIADSTALRLAPRLETDVIVLDLGAERVNSLAALPWLAELPGEPVIIALGASNTPSERKLALELGASGYVAPESAALLIGGLAEGAPTRGNVRLLPAA